MTRGPSTVRLATYNTEWFNALVDDRGFLLLDDKPSSRHQITREAQLRALGAVFRALDADGVLVVEGPDTNRQRSTVKALERFARHFGLRARAAVHGFASDTEQEIGFLYDPDRLAPRHDPQASDTAPRFDGTFRIDLNSDLAPEPLPFSKPPLELAIDGLARPLRLIGVHAKSKAPHGARDAQHLRRLQIENRRKQLAQCIWLRGRVEAHLAAGDDLVVLGDFNDGPGLDEFEALFGRSGVEIVLGVDVDPALRLHDPHAALALSARIGLAPTTARFWHGPTKRYFEALLDFVMVSPRLAALAPAWRIWHPFNDPQVDEDLRRAILTASDHFPVTLDIELGET